MVDLLVIFVSINGHIKFCVHIDLCNLLQANGENDEFCGLASFGNTVKELLR